MLILLGEVKGYTKLCN